MLTRALPLLTAVAFAAGALNAHRLPPRTVWGDVYDHVPNHLVTAGMALLVAGSLLALGRLATTGRAGRACTRAGGAWALVSVVFVLDAVGGGLGDSTGDYRLHDAAMVLLPASGVLLFASTIGLVATRSGWAPWPLRLAAPASVPGTLALNEASSGPWLAAGLAAAAAWLVVAVHTTRRPLDPAAENADAPVPVRP